MKICPSFAGLALGIAAATGLIASEAKADTPDWTYMGSTNQGESIFANIGSLHMVGPKRFTIWIRLNDSDGSYFVTLDDIDCNDGTYRTRQLTHYSSAGYTIYSGIGTRGWSYAIPGSTYGNMVIKACS